MYFCKSPKYFFLSLLFLSFLSCVNNVEDVNEAISGAEPYIEHGKDVVFYYSEAGDVKIKVSAPTVTRYNTDKPYTEFNDGLVVLFYDDSMHVTSTLTANYGVRYEAEQKTIVRNNVVVVNIKHETLSTEELTWDEKKHIIYSDKFVKIVTPDQVLYGEGMEADEQMTKYTIRKPQGTIKTPAQ